MFCASEFNISIRAIARTVIPSDKRSLKAASKSQHIDLRDCNKNSVSSRTIKRRLFSESAHFRADIYLSEFHY